MWSVDDPLSLSVQILDAIVDVLSPFFVSRLLEIVNQKHFAGHALNAWDQLPEAPLLPSGGFLQHSDLLEDLQGFMGSYDLLSKAASEDSAANTRDYLRTAIAPLLPPSHPWQSWLSGGCALMLPPDSVLCTCWSVMPVLLSKIPPEIGAQDINAMPHSSVHRRLSPPASSPADEAFVERCRQRVFALERELVAREHAKQELEAFEKHERERNERRLMDINKHLQEKLRLRTEELKRAGQKVIEAQRNVDDFKSQLATKKREVTMLQYQLEREAETKKASACRLEEHTRSMLRSAARESLMRRQAHERAAQLRQYVHGEEAAGLIEKTAPDAEMVDSLVGDVEADFLARIRRRQDQYVLRQPSALQIR